jgi:tyrosine-protein phosphatase SIW14
MGWTVDEIVEEYSTFAKPKIREVDIKYIHGFNIHSLQEFARRSERDTLGFLSELATFLGSTRMPRTVLFMVLVLCIWGITVMDLHTGT